MLIGTVQDLSSSLLRNHCERGQLSIDWYTMMPGEEQHKKTLKSAMLRKAVKVSKE